MVTSTNPTIATVLGITARLAGIEADRARPEMAEYEQRIKLLMQAAKAWAREMDQLMDAVQQRPDLYPVRIPEHQMPAPDGYERRRDALIVWWRIDHVLRLGYHQVHGWVVYEPTEEGVPDLYVMQSLKDLAHEVRRARTGARP